jgi:hypothetical protein
MMMQQLPLAIGKIAFYRSTMKERLMSSQAKLAEIQGNNASFLAIIQQFKVCFFGYYPRLSIKMNDLGLSKSSNMGYKRFFLTCIGTPHRERLCNDIFFFDEIATITYNNSSRPWKALWRRPFHNPVKKIEYSQAVNGYL